MIVFFNDGIKLFALDKYCAVVESMFQRSRAGAVVDGSVDIDGEEW